MVVGADRRAARRHQADRAPQARPAGREAMMLERFTGDARRVVRASVRPPCGSGTCLDRLRAPPARPHRPPAAGRRGPARAAASPPVGSGGRSSACPGGAGPACSTTSTGTRWPPSGSISTPSARRSRRPSARAPSPRRRAGGHAGGAGCAAGCAGPARPGGRRRPRPAAGRRPARRGCPQRGREPAQARGASRSPPGQEVPDARGP